MYSDIKKNYNGNNARFFAEKYKKAVSYILTLAYRLKVTTKPKRKEEFKKDVLRLYFEEKLTIQEIHEKLNLGKCSIGKLLAEVGGGRNQQEAKPKIYSCDENYFEEINTPEKAYWFGFIAADGNLHQQKLQICLATKDESHLHLFCKRINYNGSLINDKRGKRLIIARKKIHDDLISHGMEINKTLKINEHLFDKIPEKYIPAAMLGYFDGDGSFPISTPRIRNHKKVSYLEFSIVGNEGFLSFFKKRLEMEGISCSDVKKDKRTKQTHFFYTRLNKERANLLYDFFYKGENSSKDFLDRKRKRLTLVLDDGKFT